MKFTKTYEPSSYESDIYALWETAEAFKPRGVGKPYSIVVPPPNANGNLHIGTAFTLMLEDIAVRYHRLKGERTLFVPGADHAGFETWVVYEKKLAQEGKSRFDFSRDELYNQVWNFVAVNRKNFEKQFRRLGVSVDWQHFTFTLDSKVVKRAYATFQKMWEENLIYRGERLVNFCTFHGTSFADIEVEYRQEPGKLYYIRYPLTDGSGEVVVATTRPETILGDTGVAVNPKDARHKLLIGKTVRLPLIGREVPIVADGFVDPKFGTGVVKLTPGHDPNDFDASERHNLPKISVISHEGRMADIVPEEYRHLKVSEARQRIVKDLQDLGLLEKTDNIIHSVGHCYKCDIVIEPLLREQWFVDMKSLAARAIKTLEEGEITFYPSSKCAELIEYLRGLRDWNISRQIPWGIPIPAFQNTDQSDDWIFDDRVNLETIKKGSKTYRRDPDVFDTWFSSSSWPYAVLDYPDSQDFKEFYPLSLMETGGEILYPWVGRMIMLGLYVTGRVPFKEVYIHGYVMAEDGSKMSKSIGNVIDPGEVMDKYGSDALRMGIIAGRTPAVNRGYDPRKVEDARNFCNKLWNVARYVEDKVGDGDKKAREVNPKSLADNWILVQLNKTAKLVASDLDKYNFADAYDRLYHFVWDDFADWYIEANKVQPNNEVLAFVLKTVLKLIHPFAPFVTEIIWKKLSWKSDSMLMGEVWPEIPQASSSQAKHFDSLKALVTELRNIQSALHLTGTNFYTLAPEFILQNAKLIERLAKIKFINAPSQPSGLKLIRSPYEAWLSIDPKTLNDYKKELQKKHKLQLEIVANLKKRLTNSEYLKNAPLSVVKQSRSQLAQAQQLLATSEQEFHRFDS